MTTTEEDVSPEDMEMQDECEGHGKSGESGEEAGSDSRVEVPGCKRPLSTEDPDYARPPDSKRLKQMQNAAQSELSERVLKVVEHELSEAMNEKHGELEEIDRRILRLQQCLHTLRFCISLNYYASDVVNSDGKVEKKAVMHPAVRQHLHRKSQDPGASKLSRSGRSTSSSPQSKKVTASEITTAHGTTSATASGSSVSPTDTATPTNDPLTLQNNKAVLRCSQMQGDNKSTTVNMSIVSTGTGDQNNGKQTSVDLNKALVDNSTTPVTSGGTSGDDKNLTCTRPPSPKYLPPKPPDNTLSIPQGRRQHCQSKRRVIVGNTYQYLTGDAGEQMRYKWQVYVRTPPEDPPATTFTSSVTFLLDHSYSPHHFITLRQPPFVLSRRGWGEFKVHITLNFKDARNKPVRLLHPLVLSRPDDPLALTGLWRLGQENWYDLWVYLPDQDADQSKTEAEVLVEEDNCPANLSRELEEGVVASEVDGHVTVLHQSGSNTLPPSHLDSLHSSPSHSQPHSGSLSKSQSRSSSCLQFQSPTSSLSQSNLPSQSQSDSPSLSESHSPSLSQSHSPSLSQPHSSSQSCSQSQSDSQPQSQLHYSLLCHSQQHPSSHSTPEPQLKLHLSPRVIVSSKGDPVSTAQLRMHVKSEPINCQQSVLPNSASQKDSDSIWQNQTEREDGESEENKGENKKDSKVEVFSGVVKLSSGVNGVNGFGVNKVCRIQVRQPDGQLLPYLIPAHMYSLAVKIARSKAEEKKDEQGPGGEGQAANTNPGKVKVVNVQAEKDTASEGISESRSMGEKGTQEGSIKESKNAQSTAVVTASSTITTTTSEIPGISKKIAGGVSEGGILPGRIRIVKGGCDGGQVVVHTDGGQVVVHTDGVQPVQPSVALVQQLLNKQVVLGAEGGQQRPQVQVVGAHTSANKSNIQLMPVRLVKELQTKGSKPIKILAQKPVTTGNIKFVTNNGQFISTGKIFQSKTLPGSSTSVLTSALPLTTCTNTTTTTATGTSSGGALVGQTSRIVTGAELLQLLAKRSKMAMSKVSPIKLGTNSSSGRMQVRPLMVQRGSVSLLHGDMPTHTPLKTSTPTLFVTASSTKPDEVLAKGSSFGTEILVKGSSSGTKILAKGGGTGTEILAKGSSTGSRGAIPRILEKTGATGGQVDPNQQRQEDLNPEEEEALMLWEERLSQVSSACEASVSVGACVSAWLKVLPLVVPPDLPPPPLSFLPFSYATSTQQFLQWPLPKQRAAEFQRAYEVVRRVSECGVVGAERWRVEQVVAWARRHAYTPVNTRLPLRTDQLKNFPLCPPGPPEFTLTCVDEEGQGQDKQVAPFPASPTSSTSSELDVMGEEEEHKPRRINYPSPEKRGSGGEELMVWGGKCEPDGCEWVTHVASQLRLQLRPEVIEPGYRAHAAAASVWRAVLCLMEDLLRRAHCQAWGDGEELGKNVDHKTTPPPPSSSYGPSCSSINSSSALDPLRSSPVPSCSSEPSHSSSATSSSTYSSPVPSHSSSSKPSSLPASVPPALLSLRHAVSALKSRPEFDLFTDVGLGKELDIHTVS